MQNSQKDEGRQSGPVGKGLATETDLSLIPGNQLMEGEDQVMKTGL